MASVWDGGHTIGCNTNVHTLNRGMRTVDASDGTIVYFAGIDKARFKRQVIPGDQLTLKIVIGSAKKRIWRFDAEAWVGNDLACRAQLMAIPSRPEDMESADAN